MILDYYLSNVMHCFLTYIKKMNLDIKKFFGNKIIFSEINDLIFINIY